ncbi:PaaI family thioesterase [Limnochorda pilosa]|uniref:Acyl-coenzyme A thioesterase THEM4 n=1 Tax=Limnochorda pilosa TaxID=1555112 RepID=A0A0K2SQE6_LIMPI|nr:PaaI family thioesterase [Limnochorda pilosa]BAS29217.1 thioesterase [Limnochorda pilosa]
MPGQEAERPPGDAARAMCFVCGPANPYGLHVEFVQKDGASEATFTPPAHLQGWPGVLHGGIVITLLDEALAYAAWHAGLQGMTARLEVRLRRPAPLETPLVVRGWLEHRSARAARARAELLQGDTVLAEASGVVYRARISQDGRATLAD